MKFFRHGPLGQERPGLIDAQGLQRDLSGHMDDIGGEALHPSALATWACTMRSKPLRARPLYAQTAMPQKLRKPASVSTATPIPKIRRPRGVVQPVTGFQVCSVHSMLDSAMTISLQAVPSADVCTES
mgnify:CR=1 FL=1